MIKGGRCPQTQRSVTGETSKFSLKYLPFPTAGLQQHLTSESRTAFHDTDGWAPSPEFLIP